MPARFTRPPIREQLGQRIAPLVLIGKVSPRQRMGPNWWRWKLAALFTPQPIRERLGHRTMSSWQVGYRLLHRPMGANWWPQLLKRDLRALTKIGRASCRGGG